MTGANKGLGRETVRRLADLGWRVFLAARDAKLGQAVAAELAEGGSAVEFVSLDVTSAASIEAAVEAVARRTARPDVLVDNAGIGGTRKTPELVEAADFRAVFETNVSGPVQVTPPRLHRSPADDGARRRQRAPPLTYSV
ncbi:SDR family NAD(P)-dependent oxidoreductase [Nocardia sp. NPDC004573]